jgi:hypothetical protein
VVSSTDVANTLNYFPSFDFESYMAVMRSMNPPGIPVITVNFGTGTPQEAAAWVHYAKAKGYGIKYWQIGNETEGSWETGGPINAQDYVRRYIEFYDAMKAEDPSIIVTGPVAGGLSDSANMYDGKTVTQDFISLLHAQGKDAYIEALDFHWYPNYGNYTEAPALASVTLDGQLSRHHPIVALGRDERLHHSRDDHGVQRGPGRPAFPGDVARRYVGGRRDGPFHPRVRQPGVHEPLGSAGGK